MAGEKESVIGLTEDGGYSQGGDNTDSRKSKTKWIYLAIIGILLAAVVALGMYESNRMSWL